MMSIRFTLVLDVRVSRENGPYQLYFSDIVVRVEKLPLHLAGVRRQIEPSKTIICTVHVVFVWYGTPRIFSLHFCGYAHRRHSVCVDG